jgi:hypothetical protein
LALKQFYIKKCRSGKNSEGPAENPNFKKSATVTKKWQTMSEGLQNHAPKKEQPKPARDTLKF